MVSYDIIAPIKKAFWGFFSLPYPFISIELIHEQAQHRMEAESYAAPTYIDSSSLPFQLVLLSLITRPI